MMQGAQLRSSLWDLTPHTFQKLWAKLESSPIGKRLVHGTLWSFAGSLISGVLALVAAMLVARLLGKASYGELGIIQSTIGMFGSLAGFGIGTTAAKFVAEFRCTDPAKAGKIIALSRFFSWSTGITFGTVLFFLAPWLTRSVFTNSELSPYIQLSALLLLLNAVNSAQTGVLSGFESFRKIAWISGLTGVLNFPFVVGGAMLFGLSGVVWGMIVAQASGCLANAFIWKREANRLHIPIAPWSRATSELPLIWRFAVPATLGSLLVSPVAWATTAMLARQPDGFEQIGALSAANQWLSALMWLPNVMAQSVMPILSERIGANDANRSTKLFIVSIKISAAITLPFVIIGSLLSSHIMGMYGEDFASDWPTFVAALATGAVIAVQVPVGNMIAASNRMWLGFGMNLLCAVVFLVMTWFLLEWGALGVASARFLAYTAQGIWSWVYAVAWVRTIEKG